MRAALPATILAIGLAIAASIALTSHWSLMAPGGAQRGIYRLNRWTGEVIWCVGRSLQPPDRADCTIPEPDDWVKVK